jgi:hypothetical protein
MGDVAAQFSDDEVQARRERRAELLEQRERAALLRRQRGFRLRPPASQPLIPTGSARRRVV